MANVTASHSFGSIVGPRGMPAGFHASRPVMPTTVLRAHHNEDRSIIPGGKPWTQTIRTTANLGRSQLTQGASLEFSLVRLPMIHDAGDLPYCIELEHYPELGESVGVTETDRTFGLAHLNTAHNQMLTDGTLKQHRTEKQVDQYATDVAEMPTPHLYNTLFDISNKFFVDTLESLWRDAKSRMLRTLHLKVRLAMKREFPTNWNLVKDDPGETRRMFKGTYAAMNQWPRDWVAAVYGVIAEAMTNRGFVLANGVMGNILLVPRQACVEEFGNAPQTIKSQDKHEAEDDQNWLYPVFRVETGEVISTAVRTGDSFNVGRFTVVPYDNINTGLDPLADSFFERRTLASAVIVPRDSVSVTVPSPQGTTVHSTVSLAISAGLYYEDCCLNDTMFSDPAAATTSYFKSTGPAADHNVLQPPFPPTVGGTWALQTNEGAAELCGWLERVAKTFGTTDTTQIKNAIKRRTGFQSNVTSAAYLADAAVATNTHAVWMQKHHRFLYGRLSGGDDTAKVICLLALLPGSRMIMTYLHELSPFNICNFGLYMAGWANCADGYMMHPKPMTVVTSDNGVAMFSDPTKLGVKRWRIFSRCAIFRNTTQPDVRITDIFISGVKCRIHQLSTARILERKMRIEEDGAGNASDGFAIFCGTSNVFPEWCRYGTDSLVSLPLEEQIGAMLIGNKDAAEYMYKMLSSKGWALPTFANTAAVDAARECACEQWAPWTATITKTDGTTLALPGMNQSAWR